jgi:hypothetical protein
MIKGGGYPPPFILQSLSNLDQTSELLAIHTNYRIAFL